MSGQLAEGTLVGERYRIIRPLGTGGFGTVYEAQHLFIKRTVAIKVLDRLVGHPHREKLSSRFLREAELAARVEHPNIVTVYDFGFAGEYDAPYLAMQLLDGHDLRDELTRGGPLTPTRALSLFIPLLDGLAEAHRLEIIHKDLKPNNLILRYPGDTRESLCVVDFGLACLLDRDVGRLTSSGHLSGTPRYLSPEYIREQLATPALDVYQMGLILVEALTARPVIASEDLYVVLMAHCNGQLAIPAPLLESPLGPVLKRALALSPQERYPEAGAFRDALKALDPATIPATALIRTGEQRMLSDEPSGPVTVRSAPTPPSTPAPLISAPLGPHTPERTPQPVPVPVGIAPGTTGSARQASAAYTPTVEGVAAPAAPSLSTSAPAVSASASVSTSIDAPAPRRGSGLVLGVVLGGVLLVLTVVAFFALGPFGEPPSEAGPGGRAVISAPTHAPEEPASLAAPASEGSHAEGSTPAAPASAPTSAPTAQAEDQGGAGQEPESATSAAAPSSAAAEEPRAARRGTRAAMRRGDVREDAPPATDVKPPTTRPSLSIVD